MGLALLAWGLLTLLGLVGLSQGALISPWIRLLQRGLGWGSYLIPFILGWVGVLIIRQRADQPFRFPLGQALALEGVYFVLLALLALISGLSLDRAEAGQDGGIVGWCRSSIKLYSSIDYSLFVNFDFRSNRIHGEDFLFLR